MRKLLLFCVLCTAALTASAEYNFDKYWSTPQNIFNNNFSYFYKQDKLDGKVFYDYPLVYKINEAGSLDVVGADIEEAIINIPSTVTHEGKTYTVTSISGLAFQHCTALTTLTIPSTVNYIYSVRSRIKIKNTGFFRSGPFKDCENLTTINNNAVSAQDFWTDDQKTNNLFLNLSEKTIINTPASSDYSKWEPLVNGLALNAYINNSTYGTWYCQKNTIVPENVEVYAVNEVNFATGEISISKIGESGDIIPANTGVLVKGKKNGYVKFITTAKEATVNVENNLLVGASSLSEESGSVFALADQNEESPVFQLQSGKMSANSAFLHTTGKANGTIGLTGIQSVTDNTTTNQNAYDLQGRRVKTQKGINIVSGKKVYNK